jgi:hypothetical protein
MKTAKSAPHLRWLAPLLGVAVVAAACSNNLGALCLPGTEQAGVFITSLTFVPDSKQCFYSTDGGTPAASLAATGTDAGPVSFSAAICSGYDDAGVATVYLALPAIVRGSPLGAGGTFSFGTTSIVQGTACGCDIYVAETISGSLTGTTDAGVTLNGDGGLPTLLGFRGTVVDQITDNAAADAGTDAGAGATCSCNLPCDLQYTLSAVPIAP